MFWLPHKREEIQTLVFDKTNDINKTYSSRQNTRKKIANRHSFWLKQATLVKLSGLEKTMATSLQLKIYVLASPQKRGYSFQTLVFD